MKEQAGDSLCLCDSGKKYENCCFEKLIEFPKSNDFKNLPPNDASEVSSFIKAHIQNKEFSSLKELNQELNQLVHHHNTKPIDDFLNLSPNQMRYALYNPFSLKNEIFTFEYGNHFEKNIQKIPLLDQALYFLNKLYEIGAMKATKKGNLPVFFVKELYQKFFLNEKYILIPHKEEDLIEVIRLKYILNIAGLIKKRYNKFSLTKKGEKLIKDKKIKELFNQLVLTLFNKLNWATFDLYSELPFLQASAMFNLHLVNKKAEDWISGEELGKIFLRAFPNLIFDIDKSAIFDPETEIVQCFNVRFLDRVCLLLGFLERKVENKGINCSS